MTRSLEQVLADWREDAAVLRQQGHRPQAESIESLVGDVVEAAHEYLTWIGEDDAMLRSGRSQTWLRGRFPEWERASHARRKGRKRWYRMLVVPYRANTSAAYEDGLKAGEEDHAA